MTEPEAHPEPVVVASYAERGEAEVTKALLVSNGIDAAIVDEVAGGTVPVDGEHGVRVLVPAADAAVARSIVVG